jgi:hypothetical protein
MDGVISREHVFLRRIMEKKVVKATVPRTIPSVTKIASPHTRSALPKYVKTTQIVMTAPTMVRSFFGNILLPIFIGCGWCDSTLMCLPVFNNGTAPCQLSCPDNQQCWKTSVAYGASCATKSCSAYSNCFACAAGGT